MRNSGSGKWAGRKSTEGKGWFPCRVRRLENVFLKTDIKTENDSTI